MAGAFDRTKQLVFLLVPLVITVTSFQNCGKFEAKPEEMGAAETLSMSLSAADSLSCFVGGRELGHGQDIQTYQNSTVPSGENCVSEVRKCRNGILSGSYSFLSCQVTAKMSCLFQGQQILDGTRVTGYQSSSVPFGKTCLPQSMTCDNGNLAGAQSFPFGTCAVAAPASCLFNGQPVKHNETVTAYASSSVKFGETCKPEKLSCLNGVLGAQAQFPFSSCVVDQPASCLFGGKQVAHGQQVKGYKKSVVDSGLKCEETTLTCQNGVLAGSDTYPHAACAVSEKRDCQFDGMPVMDGQVVQGFAAKSVAAGQACRSSNVSCKAGVMQGTGGFAFSSCQVQPGIACVHAGQHIPSGHEFKTYLKEFAFPEDKYPCADVRRLRCTNGVVSDIDANPPWGGTWGSVASYPFLNCAVKVFNGAACNYNGTSIADGQRFRGYRLNQGIPGYSCIQGSYEMRCVNGQIRDVSGSTDLSWMAENNPYLSCQD